MTGIPYPFSTDLSAAPDKRPDFDEFWETTLAELASVPMDAVLEYSPEHSNNLRKSYRVELNSFGGVKMGGMVPFPAGKDMNF